MDERSADLYTRLPAQIRHAQERSPAFAELLDGVDAAAITSPEAFAQLPVLRKSELIERREATPPFGGLTATPVTDLRHVYASPGPIYEPEGRNTDYWRMARALFAAGFRSGDLVHNTFTYHFTPGGWMMESAARTLGCPVFPAGVGQTELQVQAIAELHPVGYTGTPSFLKIILDKAAATGQDISSLVKALVSGEALPASLRGRINDKGIAIFQCYATADLGLIAFETAALEGMVVDEQVIVEIVRPGTGDPVPAGEVGEVVVTPFNPHYPLVRFATGDLSAVLEGSSPCGRTNMRIKGWLGRADQTTKVKGMFVHPEQVAAVVARHREIGKARLVVDRDDVNDTMVLQCESPENARAGLADAIETSIREICKLRGSVKLVEVGALPNDGKVIEDRRPIE